MLWFQFYSKILMQRPSCISFNLTKLKNKVVMNLITPKTKLTYLNLILPSLKGCTELHGHLRYFKEACYLYVVNARYLRLRNSVLWLVIASPFSSVLIGYPSICRTSVTLWYPACLIASRPISLEYQSNMKII